MMLLSYKIKVMKRMVVLFNSKYKQDVKDYLVMNRVQYSMYTDIYTGEVRLSVPHSKGVLLTAELRRASVPYELI